MNPYQFSFLFSQLKISCKITATTNAVPVPISSINNAITINFI